MILVTHTVDTFERLLIKLPGSKLHHGPAGQSIGSAPFALQAALRDVHWGFSSVVLLGLVSAIAKCSLLARKTFRSIRDFSSLSSDDLPETPVLRPASSSSKLPWIRHLSHALR